MTNEYTYDERRCRIATLRRLFGSEDEREQYSYDDRGDRTEVATEGTLGMAWQDSHDSLISVMGRGLGSRGWHRGDRNQPRTSRPLRSIAARSFTIPNPPDAIRR